jgi:hypothetical protein
MKKLVLASALITGFAMTSEAQVARVFVSINGNDANDCLSPSAACRTLNGGVTKVDTGGEVILVDTGSYAGATITKSVKINVPAGNVAFSGLPITINAPGGVVVLRGLTMKALNPGVGTGVDIQAAAAVFIENCVIDGWSTGVSMLVAGELYVKASTIRNQTSVGVRAGNAGVVVSVDGARFERNGVSPALYLSQGKAGVVRSLFAHNSWGVGVDNGGSATVDQSEASNNTTAGFSTDTGTIRVLNSTVTGNAIGLQNFGGGTFESFGNNVVRGNTTNTSGTITTVGKQ